MPSATGDHNLKRLDEIKTVLRSLLISSGKQDVSLPRLNGMFREEEGENIPFREFGYPSVQEFLRGMPDVVFLRYNRDHQLCAYHVDTAKSAHVSSLVSRQRKPQKKPKFTVNYRPRSSYGNSYSSYNYSRPPSQPSTMSTLTLLRQVLDELRKAPKYFQPHNGIRKSDILQKFKERPNKSSISNVQTLNTKLKELSQHLVVDEDFVYFKEDAVKINANAGLDSVQKTVSAKYAYQNLGVRSAPSQNLIPRFETNQQVNEYKAVSNQTSQFTQVERPATTQTSQSHKSLPIQTDQGHKSLSTNEGRARELSEINCENDIITERIKFRLQKLIEKHPEGFWASELPNIYKQEYNIDLDYLELGFNSITEFVSAVPEILKITDPDDTGRHMIIDAKIPLNKMENKKQYKSLASHYNFDDFIANEKEPVPTKLSPTVCQKFIPEGMMGFDETVEPIRVGLLAIEDYFEVNISEIFTPSFFWITLRNNKSKIKKLMDELDEFYKHQDLDTCRLPQALIETGLNVACIYANMWHRAIIKKLKPDGYVVVLFYDYGTVKTYNPNHLYYLHKRFSALPAQALACGLYNVKAPQGNEWPIPTVKLFVKKVWGVPLVATVCETNENNNTMMITLTDTSDDKFDLHLNEWMIDDGLAVRGKMENIPSSKYHIPTYGVPLDKLCLYDEDILRQRNEEYELSWKEKEDKTEISNKCTAIIKQADIKDIDSASNCIADSSFDATSIATLVRENIDLTKQTNTITQAILSNLPINNLEISSRSLEIPKGTKNINVESKIDPVTKSGSEDIKKLSSDLSKNLNAVNNNFSEMINDPHADLFKTGSVHLNENHSFNRKASVDSLSSLPSSFECVQSAKPYSYELSDHQSSNQSLYSRQSNSDQSQSAQENNYHNRLISYNHDSDKLSFTDGTPTLYVKCGDSLPKKSQIPNKYPPGFVNSMINKSKIDSNATIDGNLTHKGSDEGYQTIKLTSSVQTSHVSSNTSLNTKSLTAPYTLELSDRCFRKTIHVFHLDNEGWIPVNEFIDCFTNLKLDRVMFKLLETFNVNVNYKHLTRVDNAQLFSELDQSRIKASRESNGKIKSDYVLILLPMKAMLHVLTKLDFVDIKILKEATRLMKQHKEDAEDILFESFNNKILYDALNLLVQYREHKRSLMLVN